MLIDAQSQGQGLLHPASIERWNTEVAPDKRSSPTSGGRFCQVEPIASSIKPETQLMGISDMIADRA